MLDADAAALIPSLEELGVVGDADLSAAMETPRSETGVGDGATVPPQSPRRLATHVQALGQAQLNRSAALESAEVTVHHCVWLELVLKGTPEFWSVTEIKTRQKKGGMWGEVKSEGSSLPPTGFQQMFLPIAENTRLDVLIIVCIVLNTAILAVQHPGNTYSKGVNEALDVIDLVLTSIFTLEMFIKIFAFGFYMGHNAAKEPGSYISGGWNRLDFVVVVVSWLSVLVEALDLKLPIKVSTLRALRILRVLKSLKFLKGVGVILTTLGNSVDAMGTIMMFLTFVFTIAGIVGIQMFRGTLNFRCSKLAPVPDGSGLDWIGQGVGDLTYRKHCVPNWHEPKCPEFPPCNMLCNQLCHIISIVQHAMLYQLCNIHDSLRIMNVILIRLMTEQVQQVDFRRRDGYGGQ